MRDLALFCEFNCCLSFNAGFDRASTWVNCELLGYKHAFRKA